MLNDNFDSYNDGDLNGQGGWSGSAVYDVQGAVVKAGTKAVKKDDTGATAYSIEKIGSGEAKSNLVFWARWEAGFWIQHFIKEGNTDKAVIYFYNPNGGDCILLNWKSGDDVLKSGISKGVFYRCEFEWDADTDKIRARAGVSDEEPGDWSEWRDAYSVFDVIDRFKIHAKGGGYWDEISEGAPPPPVVTKSQAIII